MKKTMAILLSAFVLTTLCGCTTQQKQTETTSATETAATTVPSTEATGVNSSIANPYVEVKDGNEIHDKLGITIALPENATDCVYYVVDNTFADVTFTVDGNEYTLRAEKEKTENLCGIYGIKASEQSEAYDYEKATDVTEYSICGEGDDGACYNVYEWKTSEGYFCLFSETDYAYLNTVFKSINDAYAIAVTE